MGAATSTPPECDVNMQLGRVESVLLVHFLGTTWHRTQGFEEGPDGRRRHTPHVPEGDATDPAFLQNETRHAQHEPRRGGFHFAAFINAAASSCVVKQKLEALVQSRP